jgi:hypothetical protein
MVYYRAPSRYPLPPLILLLAGMLLGTTLSSLLHHYWWQSEHPAVHVDLLHSSRPETAHQSELFRLLEGVPTYRLVLQADPQEAPASIHNDPSALAPLAACLRAPCTPF